MSGFGLSGLLRGNQRRLSGFTTGLTREVLDEAAHRNISMLEVLSSLMASEMTSRRQARYESGSIVTTTDSRIQSQIKAQTALAPSGFAVKQSPETCAPFGI